VTLNKRLVGLTDVVVNPRILIWKGSNKNAPEIPAIEVKNDMIKATTGGINRYVFIPATGNKTCRKSMMIIPKEIRSIEKKESVLSEDLLRFLFVSNFIGYRHLAFEVANTLS
jgi:hypothetical protein